ncbi:hypothetical protein DH2020_042666 [Rehmannia glutinosa]|uniref:Cystatin domain-containing protein n=1 Tax=Rehmannia glutinosa TaxID=99300 RepID=A0ABR0UMA8_REHGL
MVIGGGDAVTLSDINQFLFENGGVSAFAGGPGGSSPPIDDGRSGGWMPIEDLKDPEVVMAAKFAVKEHNKQANTTLIFITMVKGERLEVAGWLFRLVISAKDGRTTKPKNYRAVVWSRVWLKKKPLILDSFKEIRG